MGKRSLLVMFAGLFLFAGCASATTYYISYSSGSNANNGTSKSTPWKTHPYMQTAAGCTGSGSAPSYSHSAGDQFVFKQGDSWPNACFDMAIQSGGASGNPDVYTFDPTWGTSTGTTGNVGQAVGTYQFNAGGSAINGRDSWNVFIYDNSINNIVFNGMELTGMQWSGGSYGNAHMIELQDSQNVTVSNMWAHHWTHAGASSDIMHVVSGYAASAYNAGSRVTGSVIDGAGAADSGEAVYIIPIIDNNIIRNMSNGVLPGAGGNVHDNQIGPINQSFDSSDHENCIEPDGMPAGVGTTYYIYNNVLHDCTAINILTQGAPPSSGWEIDYLWNNVAYIGAVSTIPFQFDAVSTSNSKSQVHAWNNTIYAGSSQPCMRTVGRGNGNFGVIELVNNHCISGQGVISLGTGANTYTNVNNVLMTLATATSQGYTSSERFAYSPTQSGNATVAAGSGLLSLASGLISTLAMDTTYGGTRVPVSRSSGAWNAGAYQFGSSGAAAAPSPPTNLQVIGVQ